MNKSYADDMSFSLKNAFFSKIPQYSIPKKSALHTSFVVIVKDKDKEKNSTYYVDEVRASYTNFID